VFNVALGECEPTYPLVRVGPHEGWLILGNHLLHAFGVSRFFIGQMADHFERGPSAWNRLGADLFPGHAFDRICNKRRAGKILAHQGGVKHDVPLSGFGRLRAPTRIADGEVTFQAATKPPKKNQRFATCWTCGTVFNGIGRARLLRR
jgi:hypothetical protein